MVKKCKEGYTKDNGRCVKKKGLFSRNHDGGVTQPNRNVRYVAISFFFVLALIIVINISIYSTVKPLLISLVFIVGSLIVYSIREYQDDLSGIKLKKIPIWLFLGVIFAVVFHIITRYVPFLTLAYPVYPASIGGNLEWALINVVSPVTESLFFCGAIFAFFRNFTSKRGKISPLVKYTLILVVSVLFSGWHGSAYIFGIFALSLPQATSAFFANLSAFASAFVFMFLSLTVGCWNGVEKSDQSFFISSHSVTNILRSAFSTIKFVI